jgi:glycosyltransferase involved in cell wall biosynthesis/GT2 family glycosyltransferase
VRFSVVVPTLGRPEVLRDTLTTIGRCDPGPLEVIVVDGDSRGSGRAVVEHLRGSPVPIVYMASEAGLTKQRNAGIEAVEGDVTVFFDDDVSVACNVFSVLARVYEDDSIVGATGVVIDPINQRLVGQHSPLRRFLPGGGAEGTFTRFGYPRRVLRRDVERDVELMEGCFMSARTSLAREVGFDEALTGYALAEDEDFAYRLSRRGRIRYVPEARIHHHKIGHSSRAARPFGRAVVVNRAYLFRKNFAPTRTARIQFALLITMLVGHRILNREWREAAGLVEGSVQAWRQGRRWRSLPSSARDRPVPVAFVSSHAKLGGSERYLEMLLEGLGGGWIGCIVFLEEGPAVRRFEADTHAVHVIPTPAHSRGLLRSALRLRRVLSERRPALVHANGVKAALVAVLATTGLRLPVVWLKHDFSWDGLLARLIATRCAQVVGVSRAVLRTFGEGPHSKLRVVHNGIAAIEADRASGRRSLLEALGAVASHPGAVIVGLVGRLHPIKGHLDLLDMIPGLLQRFPELFVAFVGGDDASEADFPSLLRHRAEELGIERHARFLGHRDDVVRLMSGMDAAVMPSGGGAVEVEGFPLAALELLSVGTPVVGYAIGGLPELLADCGVLVAPGDRAGLEAGLLALLHDRKLRERLSRCGRRRVTELFSSAAMADSMKEIYLEAGTV